jgi:asparagine synthase (glutamine-hydrolysing)
MCGINGFDWEDATLAGRMNSSIHHRGPDDTGVFCDHRVTLGNNRLAIIDLSPAGHQPLHYARGTDEVWITYNGEIYNFAEVRGELVSKGYSFHSRSDTETILAAYLEWGPSCVSRFNGMWAFAIYDVAKGIIFFSRDRFGIKPLYYRLGGRGLIFSSEIKGIAAAGVQLQPCEQAIFNFLYMGYQDESEQTFFEGIKRLLPGHNAVYDLGSKSFKAERYYEVANAAAERAARSDADMLRRIFEDSIRRHLVSDVPVGSCLSGGIDSSGVVCAMRKLEPAADIQTFSLVFPGTSIDESRYQGEVVKACSTVGHQTTFTAEEFLSDLPDLVRTQEEPFSGLSPYGQYRVMKIAHEAGMKVLLDGQGADELLAGYHTYFPYLYYELLAEAKLGELVRATYRYWRRRGSARPIVRFLFMLMPGFVQNYAYKRRRGYISRGFYSRYHGAVGGRKPRKKLSEALLETLTSYSIPYLLRLEDKNAMRWSIESRVPYLDKQFVEYAVALPSSAKLSGDSTKVLLRSALEGLVPSQILQRRDKVGFQTPDSEIALSQPVKDFVKKLTESTSFRGRPYWDWRKVTEMFDKSLSTKEADRFLREELWKIVIVELWFRAWFEATEPKKSDHESKVS